MELKNGNGLNSWFNAILWLNIAFSGLGLIMNLINLMKGDNGFDLYTLEVLVQYVLPLLDSIGF